MRFNNSYIRLLVLVYLTHLRASLRLFECVKHQCVALSLDGKRREKEMLVNYFIYLFTMCHRSLKR